MCGMIATEYNQIHYDKINDRIVLINYRLQEDLEVIIKVCLSDEPFDFFYIKNLKEIKSMLRNKFKFFYVGDL